VLDVVDGASCVGTMCIPYVGALCIVGADVTCVLGAIVGGLGAACACGVLDLDLLEGWGAIERPK
jgi:hypothetical protein